ncbi:hypothetical protein FDC62_11370 [Clostridium botulinum]|uniref:hypothetical protein n=1 Tax=Clostridium botulinum TaxID=1491 RepID=UPI0009C51EC5|nr:hypothetical protein [Clostridium botulinum]NFO98782.1 hypothetical protein [Clostridium botulinum]OOV52302.1 hypothetical protein B1A66_04640 [Clostridium botulinum D/C]OOV54070.1 hypothetical protein B0673_11445 [Clostridium botulinum D/C]OOV58070.1 hypothetical protein B1A67_03480 [Clostridium botulinum D/C]
MCEIKIIDAPMGKGKTQSIIHKMNKDLEHNYIYITPFLSEVERIKESCKGRKFIEPEKYGTKTKGLEYLILNNRNIATTHSLFKYATEQLKTLLQSNKYILCLDEVMDVIQEVDVKKGDLEILLKNELITVADNGLVTWNEDKEEFQSRYNDIKELCRNNHVYLIRDKMLIWLFPIEIFEMFEEVYVMTYLFKGQIQKYYYNMFKIKYEYYHVKKELNTYKIKKGYNDYNNGQSYKNLIHIIQEDKINSIGNKDTALSVSWFKNSNNAILVKQLQKNLLNFFTNKVKSNSKNNLWTTFKKYKSKLTGNGYARGFISLSLRATNDYASRSCLAYCSNRYINPMIVGFFKDNNIDIDEDMYALSEMLQWIFRGAIRNNKEINIYIPSSRMRNLLIRWLNNKI